MHTIVFNIAIAIVNIVWDLFFAGCKDTKKPLVGRVDTCHDVISDCVIVRKHKISCNLYIGLYTGHVWVLFWRLSCSELQKALVSAEVSRYADMDRLQ